MRAISGRQIDDGAIGPAKLSEAIKAGRYFFASGAEVPPTMKQNEPMQLVPSVLDGAYASVYWKSGNVTIRYILNHVAGNAGPKPDPGNDGGTQITIYGQTAVGAEYTWANWPLSVLEQFGPWVQAIGSHAAVHIRLKAHFDYNAHEIVELSLGFRKGQTPAVNVFDDLTDAAAIQLKQNAPSGGDKAEVHTATILNNAITKTLDTGQSILTADEGTSFEIKTELRVDGSPRFWFNGAEMPSPGHVFDTGDYVFPFILYTVDNANPDLVIDELEVAYLKDITDEE